MFRRSPAFLIPVIMVVLLVRPAPALELDPYPVRNLAPPDQVHSLAIAEPVRLNRPREISAKLAFDLANNCTISQQGDESIILDGETYVTTLGLRYGLADRLQIGLDLPWVSHQGGFLDDFIEDWHKFFGVPNGDRGLLNNNQLDYRYSRGDRELLGLEDRSSGLGDMRLRLAWRWLTGESGGVNLQGTVKMPTGEAGKLTGSGGWDLSLAVAGQRDFDTDDWGKSAVWGGLGGSWLGSGGVLDEQARQWAANAWLGAGWSPWEWLGLKLQLDGHTALYRSALPELGDPALILTMGGDLAIGQQTTVEIAVGEDLIVRTSPDFTGQLSVSHRF